MTPPTTSSRRRERRARTALALGLTALLAVIIGWATLTPAGQQPPIAFSVPDKVWHALAFAALILPSAVLAAQSLPWIIAGALAYGGLIELIQPQVGRSADVGDMAANTAGVALALALGWLLRRLFRGRAARRGRS